VEVRFVGGGGQCDMHGRGAEGGEEGEHAGEGLCGGEVEALEGG
jgi:hypothetical protein